MCAVEIRGVVLSVRRHRRVLFFDVEDVVSASKQQCVAASDALNVPIRVLVQCVLPQTEVSVWGTPCVTNSGQPSTSVERVQIERAQPAPAALQKQLVLLEEGLLTKAEIQRGWNVPEEVLSGIERDRADPSGKRRVWNTLTRIARVLDGKPEERHRQRVYRISLFEEDVLARHSHLCAAYPIVQVPLVSAAGGEAATRWADIDCGLTRQMDPRRMIYQRSKKAPQISWMTQRVREVLRAYPHINHIVDIGGGQGDLSNALAGAFPSKQVRVVDVNTASLVVGRQKAAALNLSNVVYQQGDVMEVPDAMCEDVCLLVGLHACGGLSDAILHLAATRGYPALVCTCCFPSHPHLRTYRLEVDPTDWGILCRLAESSEADISNRAMHMVNALRWEAVQRIRKRMKGVVGDPPFPFPLLSFDAAFSPKNQVVVIPLREATSA